MPALLGELLGKLGLTPDAMEHVTALNPPMSVAPATMQGMPESEETGHGPVVAARTLRHLMPTYGQLAHALNP